MAPVTFARQLATLLGLRGRLWLRRTLSRGGFAKVVGLLSPPAGVLLMGMVASSVRAGAVGVDPVLLVGIAGAVVIAVHGVLIFEVTAQVGAGEGMAAALYHFPLSANLIHASETLVGALSPGLLMACVLLLSIAPSAAGSGPLGLLWMLLAVAWLVGFRQAFRLTLARILRRRFVREVAMALLSVSVLGVWLGINVLLERTDAGAVKAWLLEAPPLFWALPPNWFLAPVADLPLPAWVRGVGVIGAPLAVLSIFVLGADLQDRACYGEADSPLGRRHRARARRWHLADRVPFSLVPPAVWATAARELTTLRRDPFLMVMLASQAVLLLLPALIFPSLRGGGEAWIPGLLLLLLLAEHGPLFNVLATEGRSLRFLAQTPVTRWQVLVGKNLGYLALFSTFNLIFLALGCAVFGAWSMYLPLALLAVLGVLVLTGAGNVVSVVLPVPRLGARAAQGGARAAAAASDGGPEPPGCGVSLMRFALLQATLLMLVPPGLLVLLGSRLGAAGWVAALAGSTAWCVLIYLGGTGVAARRLESAEERILAILSTRAAA